jgi:glutamyl-tRNA reductase
MSNITIIGTGNMARTIGTLAVAGGNTVEVVGRDQSKAAELASSVPVTTAPRGEVSRPGESSLCAHSATRSTAPPSFHPTASRGLRISGEGVSRGV